MILLEMVWVNLHVQLMKQSIFTVLDGSGINRYVKPV
jgi:hypothetical protein